MEEQEGYTLAEDLRLLAEDARAFAEAEIAYQKSRAAYLASEVRGIAILAALGVVLAFFALMSLVFGLVLALAPILTAWGAAIAVPLLLLIGTGVCALWIKARMRRMKALLASEDGDKR